MNVASNTSVVRPFVISHMFHAPRARLWKAWTERERLMRWLGPAGVTIPTAHLDFRPGGSFHYCMRTPDGKTMWGKFAYREIVPSEKIVLVNSFSDEHGGISRHPLSATWPLEMLSTTTFDDAGEYAKLTIEWLPLNPTDEERRTFDSSHDSMRQGWSGTFGQLTGYLVNAD
jgi:uncharacterized protein YndB with AHSA1/START domain